MTPLDSIKWAEEKMLPYFELGVFKTPEENVEQ
jgi:2-oxoglutarate ferredoxin oxidoreductase subunit beta